MAHAGQKIVIDARVDREVLVALEQGNVVRLAQNVLFILARDPDPLEHPTFELRHARRDMGEERIDRDSLVV